MTDKEKRNKYAETFISAYNNDIFKIIWSKSGFSMAVNSKNKDLVPELKEEDFIEYAFSIIKMVIYLAEDRDFEESNNDDLEIAKIVFEKEYDLKNHLYIKKNSKIECFKFLEYELISHRNAENPKKLEADSAIVAITTEKEDNEKSFSFEISRRDLDDIINELIELREKMNIL